MTNADLKVVKWLTNKTLCYAAIVVVVGFFAAMVPPWLNGTYNDLDFGTVLFTVAISVLYYAIAVFFLYTGWRLLRQLRINAASQSVMSIENMRKGIQHTLLQSRTDTYHIVTTYVMLSTIGLLAYPVFVLFIVIPTNTKHVFLFIAVRVMIMPDKPAQLCSPSISQTIGRSLSEAWISYTQIVAFSTDLL